MRGRLGRARVAPPQAVDHGRAKVQLLDFREFGKESAVPYNRGAVQDLHGVHHRVHAALQLVFPPGHERESGRAAGTARGSLQMAVQALHDVEHRRSGQKPARISRARTSQGRARAAPRTPMEKCTCARAAWKRSAHDAPCPVQYVQLAQTCARARARDDPPLLDAPHRGGPIAVCSPR